jgi:hypothetical protein
MAENKVKLNLTVAPVIKEYLEEQSEVFGMSISAYLTMIVNQYKQQNEALIEMSKLQGYLEQFKQVAQEQSKESK